MVPGLTGTPGTITHHRHEELTMDALIDLLYSLAGTFYTQFSSYFGS